MKSIQDLCIFQNELRSELIKQKVIAIGDEYLAIEIFTDKTFRISHHSSAGATNLLMESEDFEIDINDLPYMEVQGLAKTIKENLSVKDIRVEDL